MGNEKPFEKFGKELRKIRTDAHKSLLEVSGAMELEPEQMRKIENGEERATEELIVLIISHFELEDKVALDLWRLAGYDRSNDNMQTPINGAPVPVVIPMNDARVVYTDMVNVSANNFGVVINFMQGLGANNQPMAISRVGMSLEHAVSFMKVLNETVEQMVGKNGSDDGQQKQIDNSSDSK